MRRITIALVASVALAGCVQTRQYADTMFAPPSGRVWQDRHRANTRRPFSVSASL